jgi:hypothetical protein
LTLFQATSLDQPEANTAVLKYFLDLLRAGHTKEDRSDFKDRTSFVNRFKQEYGAKLVSLFEFWPKPNMAGYSK